MNCPENCCLDEANIDGTTNMRFLDAYFAALSSTTAQATSTIHTSLAETTSTATIQTSSTASSLIFASSFSLSSEQTFSDSATIVLSSETVTPIESSFPIAIIIGICVGFVVLLASVVAIWFFLRRWPTKSNFENEHEMKNNSQKIYDKMPVNAQSEYSLLEMNNSDANNHYRSDFLQAHKSEYERGNIQL